MYKQGKVWLSSFKNSLFILKLWNMIAVNYASMWRFRNFPLFLFSFLWNLYPMIPLSKHSETTQKWSLLTAWFVLLKFFGICNYMCKHIDLITLLHQDYLEVWNTFEAFTSGVLRRYKSFLHFFFISPISSQRSHFACSHRDPVTLIWYTPLPLASGHFYYIYICNMNTYICSLCSF